MTIKRSLLIFFALGLSILPLLAGCSGEKESSTAGAGIETLDLAGMDLSYAHGDDFFRYANGRWLENQTIPADRSSSTVLSMVFEQNKVRLHSLVEELMAAVDATDEEIKIRDFFAVGMDSTRIDRQGLSPLVAELDRIEAISDLQGVQDLLAEFQLKDIEVAFSLYASQDDRHSDRMVGAIWQGGLSLPGRAYYLDDSERYRDIRADYLSHIARIFRLAGEPDAVAQSAAEVVLRIETLLAEASNTPLQNRDHEALYNPMNRSALEALAPAFDWERFFAAVGLPEPGDIIVRQPPFLEAFSEMLTTVQVEEWKTFLRWKLIDSTASFLSSEFEKANFDFFQRILNGVAEMKPRWERVLEATEIALGEALGRLYVARHFTPQTRQRVLEMVADLRQAMAQRISEREWMSEDTREKALLKLSRLNVKIGYPDRWRDYSELEVGNDSYLRNVLRARFFKKKRDLAKIGQPVDRSEWYMTPQTVNAYYEPSLNEIVFPAGILQPPYFDPAADDAVNYGAAGFVIGHEISHGFDDQGRRYDGEGNMNDWWTAADAEEFDRRARLLIEQYDGFSVEIDGETHFVDGELTLGENIADVAGLTVAYDAYLLSLEGRPAPPDRSGFTDDQRFFISAAQIWREKMRGGFLSELLETDVHARGEFRVNGAFFNVPAFYRAFDITPEAELYRSEEQRPEIW